MGLGRCSAGNLRLCAFLIGVVGLAGRCRRAGSLGMCLFL